MHVTSLWRHLPCANLVRIVHVSAKRYVGICSAIVEFEIHYQHGTRIYANTVLLWFDLVLRLEQLLIDRKVCGDQFWFGTNLNAITSPTPPVPQITSTLSPPCMSSEPGVPEACTQCVAGKCKSL